MSSPQGLPAEAMGPVQMPPLNNGQNTLRKKGLSMGTSYALLAAGGRWVR